MSNRQQGNSKTTAIIAILAIAIAVVAYFGVKYPIQGDDATGTIAPADRYRGDQISSDDVKLGDEAIAEVMQTDFYPSA